MSHPDQYPTELSRTERLHAELQDDARWADVTSLLTHPETQQGLSAADATITEYYQRLEADGKKVTPVLKGVTPTGDCIHVAEYRDGNARPDDFHQQGSSAWPRRYAVFAFPISDVSAAGFAENLNPRDVGYVQAFLGGGINLDVAKPGVSFAATHAHVKRAIAEGLRERDSDTLEAIKRAAREQRDGADKLHLIQVHSDVPTFNEQPIKTFEAIAHDRVKATEAGSLAVQETVDRPMNEEAPKRKGSLGRMLFRS